MKIENQKLNFKEKAQAKVGSLDNVGHVPAGGTVKVCVGPSPVEVPHGFLAANEPRGSELNQISGAHLGGNYTEGLLSMADPRG